MNSSISSSRNFVWTFLSVVLGSTLLFAIATEILIRYSIEPNHNYFKYRDLFRRATTPNAIFGDSHAAYGITGLDGFVNLAYGGENLSSITGKIRLYFAAKTPGKIILQAGFHHFSRDFLNWRQDETVAFREFLSGQTAMLRMLEPVHAKEVFNYWRVLMTKGRFVPKEEFMADGSRLSRAVYADRPARVRLAAEARTARILEPVQEFRKTPSAREFAAIIDFLRARGAEVCLVTFPAVDSLRRAMLSRPRFRDVEAFFSTLARDKGVKYISLLKHELPLEAFADPHHVNARGARIISRQIGDECFLREIPATPVL